jgi:hypothetical protein
MPMTSFPRDLRLPSWLPARLPATIFLVSLLSSCTLPGHEAHGGGTLDDARIPVRFPEPMRSHTLANMRDHLLALQEIQEALAAGQFERAASVAEARLGLTSLTLHGAHEVAGFMPDGMQAIGSEMHRAASRFALLAGEAAATGELKPALAALGRVTAQCVACHAGYRLP